MDAELAQALIYIQSHMKAMGRATIAAALIEAKVVELGAVDWENPENNPHFRKLEKAVRQLWKTVSGLEQP